MEVEIGHAAGEVWRYLNEHGQTSLTRLKQGTKLSDQMVLMAVGWLAKEQKLTFEKDARTVKVALREAA